MTGLILDRFASSMRMDALARVQRLVDALATTPEGDWEARDGPDALRAAWSSDFRTLSVSRLKRLCVTLDDTPSADFLRYPDGCVVDCVDGLLDDEPDGRAARMLAGTLLAALSDPTTPVFEDRPWEPFRTALAAAVGRGADGLVLQLGSPWSPGRLSRTSRFDDRPALADPAALVEVEAMIPPGTIATAVSTLGLRITVMPLRIPLAAPSGVDPVAALRAVAAWPAHLRDLS